MSLMVIFIILSFLWFLRTVRAALFNVWIWEIQEYRLDRMWAHLSILSGKRLFLNWLNIVKLGLLVLFPLFLLLRPSLFLGLVIILFSLEVFLGFKEFLDKRFYRPKFTPKETIILAGTVGIEIIIVCFLTYTLFEGAFFGLRFTLLSIGNLNEVIQYTSIGCFSFLFLILSVVLPLIVFLLVLVLNPITKLFKARTIKRAKKKIKKLSNLIVIGITGSYGKTSTKEFLATILAERFNVLKTIKANTDIGVAKTILEKLKPEHQIFVVEMGAYKRGEIKAICDIVKPKIGVLTGINEQHLALFGGLENTIRAKFELIEALPEDGLGVINKKLKVSVFIPAGTTADKQNSKFKVAVKSLKFFSGSEKSDIYAGDIIVEKDKIKFKVINGEESEDFEVSLIGKQNISNILACVAVAEYLGMTLKEISEAAKKIKPIEKTMKAYQGINGITLIDDTYNANPAGVLAALDYLKIWKGRKAIVMPCLIELGSASRDVHQRIGAKIGENCDLAIITKKECYEDIKKAACENGMDKQNILFSQDPREIFEKLKNFNKPEDVILLESRVPQQLIDMLEFE